MDYANRGDLFEGLSIWQEALTQIEDMQYEAALIAKGVAKEKIYKYGFAFEGKKVLIG